MSQLKIVGYDKFKELIQDLEKRYSTLFVLFSGSKNKDGKSWCPDCVQAEPIVEETFKTLPENSKLLVVEVGERDEWRDPNCPFRKDERLKLKCVPTVLKWGKGERLEDAECKNRDLLQLLLEDS